MLTPKARSITLAGASTSTSSRLAKRLVTVRPWLVAQSTTFCSCSAEGAKRAFHSSGVRNWWKLGEPLVSSSSMNCSSSAICGGCTASTRRSVCWGSSAPITVAVPSSTWDGVWLARATKPSDSCPNAGQEAKTHSARNIRNGRVQLLFAELVGWQYLIIVLLVLPTSRWWRWRTSGSRRNENPLRTTPESRACTGKRKPPVKRLMGKENISGPGEFGFQVGEKAQRRPKLAEDYVRQLLRCQYAGNCSRRARWAGCSKGLLV